jgi:hypothetical protein
VTEPAATAGTTTRTSGKAIASLVLGIVSLFFFGMIAGLLAIVLGYQARKEMDADPSLGGRGLATAGMTLGIIGVVLWVIIILIWL